MNRKEKLKFSDPETLRYYMEEAKRVPSKKYKVWLKDFKDLVHVRYLNLPSYLEKYKVYRLLELCFGTQQQIIEKNLLGQIQEYGSEEVKG